MLFVQPMNPYKEKPNEISALKSKTKSTLLQMISNIDECNEDEDFDALQHMHKQLIAVKNTFHSLKANRKTPVLKSNHTGSWNKKIETQRFFSTKAKRKNNASSNVRLVKPTQKEICDFFNSKSFSCFYYIIFFSHFIM